MLRERSILNAEQFDSLRDAVMALEANPALLLEHVSGRGDYFDYEQYVISRCGRDTGGMIQAARSRNDINGTHLLLTIRRRYRTSRARPSISARRSCDAPPIRPTSCCRSIASTRPRCPDRPGITSSRSAKYCSARLTLFAARRPHGFPLGACAGAGTTFATDPQCTATLLGFSAGPLNSLSAITDKNPALRCVCLLAELSGNLNRIATDLQLWSMREIGRHIAGRHVRRLVNMPQKRNPYLLEWLRLGHDRIVGHCAAALSSLSHLPTGNSYQASRTAVETVAEMSGLVIDMLRVLVYAMNEIRFDADAARRAIEIGNAGATLVAESLVQQRAASFRDAHAAVGRALSGAPGATSDSLNVTAAAMLDRVHARLESANVFDALDGGGGPSTRNTHAAVAVLATRLLDQRRRQRSCESRTAATQQALDRRFMSVLA